MVAQDEAVTRILQLNKKFDTVMVYPAFGNEVSKATASDSSELLRLYHWLTSYFARKSDIMRFFANQMCTKLVHLCPGLHYSVFINFKRPFADYLYTKLFSH